MPVLWDKKTKQIVNNESADIVRMFNSAFNEHAKNPNLDLYPDELVEKIDAVNDWVRSLRDCVTRHEILTPAVQKHNDLLHTGEP